MNSNTKSQPIFPKIKTTEIATGFLVQVSLDGIHASMCVSTKEQMHEAVKAYEQWVMVDGKIVTGPLSEQIKKRHQCALVGCDTLRHPQSRYCIQHTNHLGKEN